jgi:hypothetical protein
VVFKSSFLILSAKSAFHGFLETASRRKKDRAMNIIGQSPYFKCLTFFRGELTSAPALGFEEGFIWIMARLLGEP